MCGLTGRFVAGGENAEVLRHDVTRMTATLAHRGPDDDGVWVDADAGIALGFRRLAIVDLSPLGHQPMRSRSERFTIVFNGEVYNAAALRETLRAAGYEFRGHSDTEVMLAAFEHWGVEHAVGRFIGMFAIALWDARTRALHLIRDRLGKKPLFVSRQGGVVTFGSELKALMAAPGFEREIDPSAVCDYLRFFYVPAPQSIFRNVRKLRPGCILTITDPAESLPQDRPYWSARERAGAAASDRFRGSPDEAVDAVEAVLVDAVRLRMGHADVPVGAFLSGGIDSSTVVALMQEHSARRVRTYTIGFAEKEYDEAAHAAAMARALGTEHTCVRLAATDVQAVIPLLAGMYDEPFADISQIPTYLVSRVARQDVTVALSGDGGDEVFGGYNRYVWGERLFQQMAAMPRPIRRLAGAGLTAVSPAQWDRAFTGAAPLLPHRLRYRLPGEKLHKIGALMPHESASAFYGSLVTAWPNATALVPGQHCVAGTFEDVMDASTPEDLVERMMLTDLVTYLPDNNLAKVDRASMAVSLEVRVPLLDHRLVELSFRLPRDVKVRGDDTKWILRRILGRRVPSALVDREKMGFDVPIGVWLRGPLRGWAEELLQPAQLSRGDLLNPEPIVRRWRDHVAGRANHGKGLWAVLMLQAWRTQWDC